MHLADYAAPANPPPPGLHAAQNFHHAIAIDEVENEDGHPRRREHQPEPLLQGLLPPVAPTRATVTANPPPARRNATRNTRRTVTVEEVEDEDSPRQRRREHQPEPLLQGPLHPVVLAHAIAPAGPPPARRNTSRNTRRTVTVEEVQDEDSPRPPRRASQLEPLLREVQPPAAPTQVTTLPNPPPARRNTARNANQTIAVTDVVDEDNLRQPQQGSQPELPLQSPIAPAFVTGPANPVQARTNATRNARWAVTIEEVEDEDSPLRRPTSARVHAASSPATQPPSPVADHGSNPFLQQPAAHPTPAYNPPPSPSTSTRFWSLASPPPSSRARGRPRNGRHSTVRSPQTLPTGPVGNKHRHAAKDIWTFFEENTNKKNVCLFCK